MKLKPKKKTGAWHRKERKSCGCGCRANVRDGNDLVACVEAAGLSVPVRYSFLGDDLYVRSDEPLSEDDEARLNAAISQWEPGATCEVHI